MINKDVNFRVSADTGKAIRAFKQLDQTVTKTSGSVGKTMPAGTKQAGFAMLNFNRIAQDSVFFMNSMQMGVMAVSNNLPIFIESMDRLKQTTGGTGSAMKLLAKQFLTLPNILMLGVTALTAWGIAASSSKSGTNALASSVKKLAGGLIEITGTDKTQKILLSKGGMGAAINAIDSELKGIKEGQKIAAGAASESGSLFHGGAGLKMWAESLGLVDSELTAFQETLKQVLLDKKADLEVTQRIISALQEYGGTVKQTEQYILKNRDLPEAKGQTRLGGSILFGGLPAGAKSHDFENALAATKQVKKEMVQIQSYAMMAGSALTSAFLSGANAAQALLNSLIAITSQLALISGVKSLVSLGTANPISFLDAVVGTLGLGKMGGQKISVNIDGREVAASIESYTGRSNARSRRLRS